MRKINLVCHCRTLLKNARIVNNNNDFEHYIDAVSKRNLKSEEKKSAARKLRAVKIMLRLGWLEYHDSKKTLIHTADSYQKRYISVYQLTESGSHVRDLCVAEDNKDRDEFSDFRLAIRMGIDYFLSLKNRLWNRIREQIATIAIVAVITYAFGVITSEYLVMKITEFWEWLKFW